MNNTTPPQPDVRGLRILWLKPDNPADVSVGRRRIADELEAMGAKVTLRGINAKTAKRTLRDANEYDVVVGTTRSGALVGGIATALSDTPFIVDHIDPIRQFWDTAPPWLAAPVHLAETITFRLADHVTYVSREDAARVRRWATSESASALGVSFDRFETPSQGACERAADELSGLDLRERVAIYIGSLTPLYNIRPMLQAVEATDNWSLLVLGDGPLADAVTDADAASSAVHYLGTVPHADVPGYVNAADVGVCLADEPDTLKVLEYAAAGLPVVQAHGRAEARYGEYLTYTDPIPADIAAALDEATTTSREQRHELRGLAGLYRWKNVADDYAAEIQRAAFPRIDFDTRDVGTPTEQPFTTK